MIRMAFRSRKGAKNSDTHDSMPPLYHRYSVDTLFRTEKMSFGFGYTLTDKSHTFVSEPSPENSGCTVPE